MPNLSRKLTPYQRIVRAAEQGCGLRLTADEVLELARDNAIAIVATRDDYADKGGPYDEADDD